MRSLVLLALALTACGTPEADEAVRRLPWEPVATVAFDDAGQTSLVSLPPADGRVALRVRSHTSLCFQVQVADELAAPFAGTECQDCNWRTATMQEAGVLVLDGAAADLGSIGFGHVDCETLTPTPGTGTLTIERLVTDAPAQPTVALRLVSVDAVDAQVLASDVSAALGGVEVRVVEKARIDDRLLRLVGPGDRAPLRALLEELPPRNEGVVDVVIGPCLERDTAFNTVRLAGFTPSVPGGAGPGDGVFVSRRTCGSRDDTPDDPAVVARLVAHELGHYLGLHHPEEEDGTRDDLASTGTDNLMHREPLLRDAEGLTSEQHARLLAHPFVMPAEGLDR